MSNFSPLTSNVNRYSHTVTLPPTPIRFLPLQNVGSQAIAALIQETYQPTFCQCLTENENSLGKKPQQVDSTLALVTCWDFQVDRHVKVVDAEEIRRMSTTR